jgi:hypothetical protein
MSRKPSITETALVTIGGEELTLTQAALRMGMNPGKVISAVRRGLSPSQALERRDMLIWRVPNGIGKRGVEPTLGTPGGASQ